MKCKLFGILAAFLLLSGFWHGNANIPPFAQGWYQVRLGGGGLEVGADFPSTGVRFIKSDAAGAFMWNTTTSKWSQVICQTCIPTNTTPGAYNFGYYPSVGTNQILYGPKPGVNNPGLLGLAGAPNDATVAYAFLNGHVLVSTTVNPADPETIGWIDTGPLYSSAITNATWAATSGGQVTFTVTRINNGCTIGCFFKVEGMTPSGYNGTYTAISATGTTIVAALTPNPGAFSVGGTYRSITADYGVSASRFQRALNVDPNNKDHVIVATQYDGIFETFNGTAGSAATWASLSSGVPFVYASGSSGVNLIPLVAFDKNSGVTGGNTNTVYLWTNGTTAGVYKTTTTTTGTWSLMAGSPATAQNIQVTEATIGQGDVWVTDGATASTAGSLWQYNGSWTNRQAGCCNGGISINPFNGNQIISGNPKLIYISTNGGTSFANYQAGIDATTSPWQGWMSARTTLTVGSISFDPVVNGQIWFTGGQGVWYTPTLPSAIFNWISIDEGIESLIGLSGLAIHAAYTPVFGAQDESGCQINILTQPTPPSSCIPLAASKPLTYFHNLYVPPTNPDFMVGKANFNFNKPEYSGYSTDGFLNSYLPFNTWNATVLSSSLSNASGAIKVAVSSTTGLTTWAPGKIGSDNSIICAYATEVFRNPIQTEQSLNAINFSCYTITVNDATHFTLNGSLFSGIGNPTSSSFVFFAPSTTLFDDWRGSYHITTIVDDGAGKIKATISNSQSNNISALDPICISGVTMTGATVVNGCWIVTSSSSGNLVLQGSTFVGGDSLVTAGTLVSWGLPGGSIAAATAQNIAIAPANNGRFKCSLDGGQTWTNNQPVPYQQTTVTGGPFTAGSTTINLASTSGYSSGGQFTLQLDDGSSIYLTQTGAPSGSTITFTIPLPAGVSVSAGNAVWSNAIGSGYGFASFGNLQQLAADHVATNTFYAVNINSGLYRWTNCGTPTLINANVGSWLSQATLNTQIKTVPGEQGHLFTTVGHSGSAGDPSPVASGLWRSCSGTAGTTTMERVNGFFEVRAIGFGKAKPGSTYPTVWAYGWYDAGNVRANAVLGTWKSTNDPNHGATGACDVSATQTWTNHGAYPVGWPYIFNSLSGDPYIYGMVYGGTTAGWYYGYFP